MRILDNATPKRTKVAMCMALTALVLGMGCSTTDSAPGAAEAPPADPLASWNERESKRAILDFVARVTDPTSPDFVPEAGRIATFDNDGTLWAEQPLYFQLLFSVDRVRSMAGDHPEWQTEQPFKAILEDDRATLSKMGHEELGRLLAATHTGISAEEFSSIASAWMDSARHPRFDRPFDTCIYQPMLEVLDYLRANGFKTFIVSAGGIEFMRTFTEKAYDTPRNQVVGSSAETEFRMEGERSFLMRLPEVDFIDDRAAKPVAINRHIGRRPIAAFGNSDGDLQMLQYATGGDGPGLAVIVHHDDAEREYAYDRGSKIGGLDKALDVAGDRGWTVISMRDDWRAIFPAETPEPYTPPRK